ncbi:MAG: hypothetical protein ACI4B3_08045 [Prevotella sp.]
MGIEFKQTYFAMSDEDTDKLSLSIAPRGYEPALRDILKLVSRLETLDSLDTNGMHSLAIYARIQIFRKLTVVFNELYKEYVEVKANGQYKLLTSASLSKLCKIIRVYLCENNNLYNRQFFSSIHNNSEQEQFEEITFIIDNFTSYLNNKTIECNEILANEGIISDEKYTEKCVFEECFKKYISNIFLLAERIKQHLFVGIDDPYTYYFELAYNESERSIQRQWDSYCQKLDGYLIDECDDEVKAIILTIRKDVENSGFLDMAKQFHGSTMADMDYNRIWGKLYDEENGVIKKQKIGHILLNHSDDITASQYRRIVAFAILEPKLQNYVRERKSGLNKKQTFYVDNSKLPQNYLDADKKVFTDTMTLNDGSVVNTRSQVKKVADNINMNEPNSIGLFRILCDEAGALKGGINDMDYVRALVVINAIPLKTETDIKKICGSFQKKINGTKRNGKIFPAIDKDHSKWTGRDKQFGDCVYNLLLEIKRR